MAGHPDYEGLKAAYGNDPRTLAAEYIARVARDPIQNPTFWTHVKVLFNQMARSFGFQRPFSDSELRVLLSRARKRVGGIGDSSAAVTRFHLSDTPDSESMRPLGYDAAVKLPNGQVYRGGTHEHAYANAGEPHYDSGAEYGFQHRKCGWFFSYPAAYNIRR